MDQSKEIWKSVYIADATLNFEKHETEVKYHYQTDELEKLKKKIFSEETKNVKLKSEIEVQNKYLQSVKNSVTLIKNSQESLLKEKNDLLKQLELQRIKNREEKKQQDATLSKYKTMWEQLLSQFHELPLVEKKLDAELKKKKLEVELRTKEREFNELKNNMKLFVQINNRIFHTNFIKLAQTWINKREELKKNSQLHFRERELMQIAENSKKTQVNQQTVLNTDENTLHNSSEIDADDMMSSLQDLSVSFLISNEKNDLLKFKELQEELAVDQPLHSQMIYLSDFKENACNVRNLNDNLHCAGESAFAAGRVSVFENGDEVFKHQLTSSNTSKIPILNKIDFKVTAEKELGSRTNCNPTNTNLLSKTSAIANSARPSKIMSPKNSRIPVSNSPFCQIREPLIQKTKSSEQTNANISHSSCTVTNPHFSSLVSLKTPGKIPKKNINDNLISPKRKKQNHQNYIHQRKTQKISSSENNPKHTSWKILNKECNKQSSSLNFHEGSSSNTSEQSGKFNNFDLNSTTSPEERGINEDHEHTMRINGCNKGNKNLNETYTLDIRQEQMSLGSSEYLEPVEIVEEFEFNGSRSHPPSDGEMECSAVPQNLVGPKDKGMVSKYFRETDVNKENTPPQGTNQDIDSADLLNKEMYLNRTLQEQDSADEVDENPYNFTREFLVSPPRMNPEPGPISNPIDDEFENFSKECSKDKTSSPNCRPETTKNTSPSSRGYFDFNFSSKPKRKSAIATGVNLQTWF